MNGTHTILHNITPTELGEMIRGIVRSEIKASTDVPITKADVAKLWGCSIGTVNNAMRHKEIIPIRSAGHPKFMRSDIMNHRRYADKLYL